MTKEGQGHDETLIEVHNRLGDHFAGINLIYIYIGLSNNIKIELF
jgi:hypothetical protein